MWRSHGVTAERRAVRPFRPFVVLAATVAWFGVLLHLTNILVALVLTTPFAAPGSSAAITSTDGK